MKSFKFKLMLLEREMTIIMAQLIIPLIVTVLFQRKMDKNNPMRVLKINNHHLLVTWCKIVGDWNFL